jgi:aldehyde dehydrogenase (NAD+)
MLKFAEELQQVEGKHFINGEFISSNGQDTFEVINPATEQPIGRAAVANEQDVDLAVEAANSALKTWRQTDAHIRGTILLKVS